MFEIFKPKPSPIPRRGLSHLPHMINTHKGFVVDNGNGIYYTNDSRHATVFPDFLTADTFAKKIIVPTLHHRRQYYAILITA
jgi:hypothetical protein